MIMRYIFIIAAAFLALAQEGGGQASAAEPGELAEPSYTYLTVWSGSTRTCTRVRAR